MMITQKYCFALDLVDDSSLQEEYKKYHQKIWPEISKSIADSGIVNLEIYCVGNRLFMILEADETFSFDRKAEMDANNPIVQKWEDLMWKYQKALPGAKAGEKWMLMDKIFDLKHNC